MHEDNSLCLRKRKFVVTADSKHNPPVYPNLAGSMTLTGIDQLWFADVIYIRMDMEFVDLAVLLDAFSRRVIGWALDRHLEDDLAIAALELAFRCRAPYSAPKYKRRLRPSTVQMAERFAAPFLLSAEEPVG